MNRRAFLATTAAGAAVAAFPAILKAQGGDTIKVGFPGPTTGPFGALAKDQQQGAIVAMEEINAKGGILGRRLEILFRDDQLKPAVGAQRTKELIENERCEFIVGGLAAHVQMAINEQTKKAGKLFISVSQSDEITARPDWGPLTFHEALNPTITSRSVGHWLPQLKEGGPDLYADIYAGINFSWQLEDAIPEAKNYVALYRKKHNEPPGDYSAYAYSAIHEVARGITLAKVVNSDAVASALIANHVYNQYKGKQSWRARDHKAFQDLWIVKGRERSKMKGEWDFVDIVQKVAASEELDRSCKEKGFV